MNLTCPLCPLSMVLALVVSGFEGLTIVDIALRRVEGEAWSWHGPKECYSLRSRPPSDSALLQRWQHCMIPDAHN